MNKSNINKVLVVLKAPNKVANLLVFAQAIHDAMAANTSTLPSPSPALTVLQSSIDTLAAKQTVVQTRVKGAVGDRDAAQKALMVILGSERGYVESVCNGSPTTAAQIAEDAGMSLRKTGAHTKPPLAVKAGATSGVVEVSAKATKGAGANNWQYSLDGGKTWIDLPSTTKAKTTISNLVPGTTVQVRQQAITKSGEGDWSVPVPHVVA